MAARFLSAGVLDAQLRSITRSVHIQVRRAAEQYGQPGNCVVGANLAGLVTVADAMLDEQVA